LEKYVLALWINTPGFKKRLHHAQYDKNTDGDKHKTATISGEMVTANTAKNMSCTAASRAEGLFPHQRRAARYVARQPGAGCVFKLGKAMAKPVFARLRGQLQG